MSAAGRLARRVPVAGWCAAALLAGAGLLAPLAVATTHAALADQGRLHSAVGGSFGIGAVTASGRVALGEDGMVSGTFPSRTDIVPGSTVTLPVTVFNNSAATDGRLFAAVDATSTVADLLRVTVVWTDAEGTRVIAGDPDAPQDGVPLADLDMVELGTLAARSAAPLATGADWHGDPRSTGEVRVLVHLRDGEAARRVAGGSTALAVTVVGESA